MGYRGVPTHLMPSAIEMGGEGAFLEPHESVTPFIKLLKNATDKDSGKFFSYDGSEKPW